MRPLTESVSQEYPNALQDVLSILRIEANKHRIFCGGPTINPDGHPEMMLIILDAPDVSSAEAFIQAEPYNQAGLFAKITIREWRQILPESHPGALLDEIGHV